MTNFKLLIRDLEKEFQVSRQSNEFRIEWNGHPVHCRLLQQNGAFFVLQVIDADGANRLIRAAGSASGEDRQLWVNGQVFNYTRIRGQSNPGQGEESLAASIPAVVSQILVTAGDRVSAGEKLILLESMKMIIPIHAPYGGQVIAVNCEEGASVQAGVQLIELRREDPDA